VVVDLMPLLKKSLEEEGGRSETQRRPGPVAKITIAARKPPGATH
jgi:hypothetical protein